MANKKTKQGKKGGKRFLGSGESAKRPQRPQRQNDRRPSTGGLTPLTKNSLFLYSRNAIEAALKNKDRECLRLIGSEKSLATNKALTHIRPDLKIDRIENVDAFDALVPPDSPHQGLLLEVRPLPGMDLADLDPLEDQQNIILILDQVSDPHNVGACLRSAAGLGARALITQDRHSPGESGVLARTAAGGLEAIPWIRTHNIAQALESLKDMGYWSVGLDGETDSALADINLGQNLVIVMGSEGKGLRPLTRKHCDAIAKIPMSGKVESLNVSVAAAIAMYHFIDKT